MTQSIKNIVVSLGYLAVISLGLTSQMILANAKLSKQAQQTAQYAFETYEQDMINSLAKMVSYPTYAKKDMAFEHDPSFIGYKNYLKQLSNQLELDYQDHGHVVLISLGQSKQKVTIVTHGDIQPVDASKWAKSPFELDSETEPGKLIGRGTEDDKGAIATAMFAMKAIKDKNIQLKRKIELMVYLAEESDWEPLREYMKTYDKPDYAITIDSEYPVVTAEKAWCSISFTIPAVEIKTSLPQLTHFSGGYMGGQIPEDAQASITNINTKLFKQLLEKTKQKSPVSFTLQTENNVLTIQAKGVSAHSSRPQDGHNAIAFLAEFLKDIAWPQNQAGASVNFLNDLIGLSLTGEHFGEIAYADDFMGPMTVSPTIVKHTNKGTEIFINMRRPRGKQAEQLRQEILTALIDWQKQNHVTLQDIDISLGEPYSAENAPHIQPLLNVYSHFTGQKNPQPIAIGGSTNAKMFNSAVSFGPSMPGEKYTGHSEHEFITQKQMGLNLKMYTAAMIELGDL